MAKKKGKRVQKRAWALVTKRQAKIAAIDFGETGCPFPEAAPYAIRMKRAKKKKK